MRRFRHTTLLLLLGSSAAIVAQDAAPPALFIDKGACPFEGCVYRRWTARRALEIVDRPGGDRVVDRVRPSEPVEALTGEVHCRPLRMVATRDHPEPGSFEPTSPHIAKGETFYLLHYLGEGAWKIWFRGSLTEIENLPAGSPLPETAWWAQVRTARGITGWVIATANFDGQDQLA